MLKKIPKVGKRVRALQDNYDVTKGKVYTIVGIEPIGGDAIFLDDVNGVNHIHKDKFADFEVVKAKKFPLFIKYLFTVSFVLYAIALITGLAVMSVFTASFWALCFAYMAYNTDFENKN